MVTKTSGVVHSPEIVLTLEAQVAMSVGDHVHVTGDYECDPADGTLPVVGRVITANVKRDVTTGEYPVANAPGPVAVGARGSQVNGVVCGADITAGEEVGIGAGGLLFPAGVGVATIGIALMGGAVATDDVVDVLYY